MLMIWKTSASSCEQLTVEVLRRRPDQGEVVVGLGRSVQVVLLTRAASGRPSHDFVESDLPVLSTGTEGVRWEVGSFSRGVSRRYDAGIVARGFVHDEFHDASGLERLGLAPFG